MFSPISHLHGANLIQNTCRDGSPVSCQAEHFYERIRRYFFTSAGGLISIGRNANAITLRDFMPVGEKIGDITFGVYLIHLVSAALRHIGVAKCVVKAEPSIIAGRSGSGAQSIRFHWA
jgi:replicative DNA helicase